MQYQQTPLRKVASKNLLLATANRFYESDLFNALLIGALFGAIYIALLSVTQ